MQWHDMKELLKNVGEDPSDEAGQRLVTLAEMRKTFMGGRPACLSLNVGGPVTRQICEHKGDGYTHALLCFHAGANVMLQDPARAC
jgi:hypothetical protein